MRSFKFFGPVLLCYIKLMQPIEVYKFLPGNNCGKCSAATCMAFAVQYLRRMISLSECPELDDEGVKEIETQLV